MTAKRRVRVVAALIQDDQDRFLVQQRLPGGSRALLWEFPGGKVEAGETDAQALERECREELGVELQAGRQRWSTVHEYADLIVELIVLSARIVSGEPRPLGANALRFATASEMRALPFCEADLPLLAALESRELALE